MAKERLPALKTNKAGRNVRPCSFYFYELSAGNALSRRRFKETGTPLRPSPPPLADQRVSRPWSILPFSKENRSRAGPQGAGKDEKNAPSRH